MINVETKDGKIAIKCGDATGAELICEASAVVVSVVASAIKRCKSKERKEALAKEVFVNITGMAATIVEKEHGISVWPDEDDDDSDGKIIAKAISMDSDTGRKLMELLGIDPDEVKSGDDDETEDDIPKFLF